MGTGEPGRRVGQEGAIPDREPPSRSAHLHPQTWAQRYSWLNRLSGRGCGWQGEGQPGQGTPRASPNLLQEPCPQPAVLGPPPSPRHKEWVLLGPQMSPSQVPRAPSDPILRPLHLPGGRISPKLQSCPPTTWRSPHHNLQNWPLRSGVPGTGAQHPAAQSRAC